MDSPSGSLILSNLAGRIKRGRSPTSLGDLLIPVIDPDMEHVSNKRYLSEASPFLELSIRSLVRDKQTYYIHYADDESRSEAENVYRWLP